MMVIKKLVAALLTALFGYLGYEGVELVYAAFPSLSVATILVVGLIVAGFDIESNRAKQAWALGVSIALSLAGWLLGLGFLVDYLFWQALVIGIGIGIVAMGLASVDMVKSILRLLGLLEKNKLEDK